MVGNDLIAGQVVATLLRGHAEVSTFGCVKELSFSRKSEPGVYRLGCCLISCHSVSERLHGCFKHIPSQSRANYSISISFSFLLLRLITSSNLRQFFYAESDLVDPETLNPRTPP
jgi:hypothetical protein